jgi:hypothetical protein
MGHIKFAYKNPARKSQGKRILYFVDIWLDKELLQCTPMYEVVRTWAEFELLMTESNNRAHEY